METRLIALCVCLIRFFQHERLKKEQRTNRFGFPSAGRRGVRIGGRAAYGGFVEARRVHGVTLIRGDSASDPPGGERQRRVATRSADDVPAVLMARQQLDRPRRGRLGWNAVPTERPGAARNVEFHGDGALERRAT